MLIIQNGQRKARCNRRLAVDYSNPATWNREKLLLENVNIRATWKRGYHQALSLIPEDVASKIEIVTTSLSCPIKQGAVSMSDEHEMEEIENRSSDLIEEVDLNLIQSVEPFFYVGWKGSLQDNMPRDHFLLSTAV